LERTGVLVKESKETPRFGANTKKKAESLYPVRNKGQRRNEKEMKKKSLTYVIPG
jgi:hypothetical protein